MAGQPPNEWDDEVRERRLPRFIADEEETRAIIKSALMLKGMSEQQAEDYLNEPEPPAKPLTDEDIEATRRVLQRMEEEDQQRKKSSSV